jgi:hypothetical protein
MIIRKRREYGENEHQERRMEERCRMRRFR